MHFLHLRYNSDLVDSWNVARFEAYGATGASYSTKYDFEWETDVTFLFFLQTIYY